MTPAQNAATQVVPVVATPEMVEAFVHLALHGDVLSHGGWPGYARDQWAAMLAAAPAPATSEGQEVAACPTCHQYSHSLGDNRLAEALLHFESMIAHPVRGHPMGHAFGERTRDAAQVLMAAARGGDGWRPIESAPKNGVAFQVWAPGYKWPEVFRWYEYDAESAEEIGEPGYFQYAEEALADQFDWEHEVTHWRPLPAAPDAGEDGRG